MLMINVFVRMGVDIVPRWRELCIMYTKNHVCSIKVRGRMRSGIYKLID